MIRYLTVLPAFLLSGLWARPALAAVITPPKLTAWTMFLNADWVVKAVMFILIGASIATWAICAAKYAEFRKVARAISGDRKKLYAAATLDKVTHLDSAAATALLAVARDEVAGCVDLGNAKSADAMTDRLSVRLASVEGEAVQSMRTGFSVLASIGATAPFIGLLGTVWGIMNSFIGISEAQTTNLAVVAPGIAEALLTTALGLVAAIPAVLLYNIFSRKMASYRLNLHGVSSRVACLVSQETERAQVGLLRLAV